jgi:TIR domain
MFPTSKTAPAAEASTTPARKRAFISFFSNEEFVADYLDSWLRGKLSIECFRSARPGDIDSGADWYGRIAEAAADSNECLLLLSPDSLSRDWIHFEAGLALGASIQVSSSVFTIEKVRQKAKHIVPLLFGGAKVEDLPSNLSRLHAVNLCDNAQFDAFALRLQHSGSPLRNQFHDDFLASMPAAVRHQLVYGASPFLRIGDKVSTQRHAGQTFTREGQSINLERIHDHKHLVGIRVFFVPYPTVGPQKWKLGVELKDPNAKNPKVFQIHAGCHDGDNTWSLYSHSSQAVPHNSPAQLRTKLIACMQLWLSKDGKSAVCLGIGSDGKRTCFLNEFSKTEWRLDSASWSLAVITGWADGAAYRVDIDYIETDWVVG